MLLRVLIQLRDMADMSLIVDHPKMVLTAANIFDGGDHA
jgi:hypothetical protein